MAYYGGLNKFTDELKLNEMFLRRIIIFIIFLIPLASNSQTFKSYGFITGYSFKENGWSKPDTFSYYYHDKAYINSITFGLFGEFFSYKYNSTFCDLTIKAREFWFEYDLGNISDAQNVKNTLWYLSLAISEKLKFDSGRWSTYLLGGVRADMMISKNIQKDFQDVFEQSKSVLFGTTVGIGFAKRFSRFLRISFDLYYNYDLTKMYKSSSGEVQLKSLGFRIGIGPFNPAEK